MSSLVRNLRLLRSACVPPLDLKSGRRPRVPVRRFACLRAPAAAASLTPAPDRPRASDACRPLNRSLRSAPPQRDLACASASVRAVLSTCLSDNMQKVDFAEGLTGYECGAASSPAVLVIQEWWGVNDTIKEHAAYLSKELGVRCLVPDLYKGTVGVTVEEAEHNMSNLDFPAAVQELSAAASYLKKTGSPSVGSIGFCMGGALSLAAIQHSPDISAGVVCYGLPPAVICDPSLVTKPVQGHFGEEDKMTGFSDPESAKKVEATLKAAGADAEFFIYPGVGHAFLNSSPAPHASFEARQATQGFPPYNQEQAQAAWGRIKAFLQKHIVS